MSIAETQNPVDSPLIIAQENDQLAGQHTSAYGASN